VSKYHPRKRKCGFCNGAGRYYPIDEGPLQACQTCKGLGVLEVKIYRKRRKSRGKQPASLGEAGCPYERRETSCNPIVMPPTVKPS